MNSEFEGSRLFLNIPARVAHDPRFKSDKSILLYGEVYSMVNITGAFYMSNKKLAERLRCSTQTVINCIHELVELGYITTQNIRDKNGAIKKRQISLTTPSKAHFTTPSKTGLTRVVNSTLPPWSNEFDEGSKAHLTQIEHINKTIKRTDKYSASHNDAQQIREDFEEIWAKYPNKKGKQQAFNHYRAWIKKSKKHRKEYLLQKLDDYLDYCQREGNWYTPMNGSTWFNGRFEDDLTTDNSVNAPVNQSYQDSIKGWARSSPQQQQHISCDGKPF